MKTSWLTRYVARVLTVILAMSSMPVPAQAATEQASPVDTYTFSDRNASIPESGDASAKSGAVKGRQVPVSASGSFVWSHPIQVPPGRLNMAPSLALTYDSTAAQHDSPVGAGWSLSVASISRSVRQGFPRLRRTSPTALAYDDASTTFSGPDGILVPAVNGPTGVMATYVPAHEKEPVRYEFIGDADGGYWIQHVPNGIKRHFGRHPVSGARARITNELGVHSWLLQMEEDQFGNHVSYTYHNIDEQNRPIKTVAQRTPVLANVEWGGNHKIGLPHVFFLRTTVGPQTGPVNLLQGGVMVSDRIERIDVGSGSMVYWSYSLIFETSGDSGRLLLKQLVRNASGETAHTTTFRYSANQAITFAPGQPLTAGSPAATEIYAQFSSLWRDSIPFLTQFAALNPAGVRSGYRFADLDGDGQVDVVYHPAGLNTTSSRVAWYHSFRQTSGASPQPLWQSPSHSPAAQMTGMNRLNAGCPQGAVLGADKMQEFCSHENPPIMGLPNEPLSALADLDGDGDEDGLRFNDVVTQGGPNSVPPSEDLEYCSWTSFWNRCGQIDPVPIVQLRAVVFDYVGPEGATRILEEKLGGRRIRDIVRKLGLPPGPGSGFRAARETFGDEAVGRLLMDGLGRTTVERLATEQLGIGGLSNPPCPPGLDPRFDPRSNRTGVGSTGGPGVDGPGPGFPGGPGLPGWPPDCVPGAPGGGDRPGLPPTGGPGVPPVGGGGG